MNALNVAEYTHSLGLQAKTASALMAKAPAAIKNKALKALARLLRDIEAVAPLNDHVDGAAQVPTGPAKAFDDGRMGCMCVRLCHG